MKYPATVFRFLILLIPAVWVVIRLLPAEHPKYGNLRAIASQGQELDERTLDRVY